MHYSESVVLGIVYLTGYKIDVPVLKELIFEWEREKASKRLQYKRMINCVKCQEDSENSAKIGHK